jgi:hypothetical protein
VTDRAKAIEDALREALVLADELRSYTHDWDWKYGEEWDKARAAIAAALAERQAGVDVDSVLPHSLFAEAMEAAECCANCAIDVFRKQRARLTDGAAAEEGE